MVKKIRYKDKVTSPPWSEWISLACSKIIVWRNMRSSGHRESFRSHECLWKLQPPLPCYVLYIFFSLGSQVSLVSTDQVGDFCVVTFASLSLSLIFYFLWFTYRFFLSFTLLIYSLSLCSVAVSPALSLSCLFFFMFIFPDRWVDAYLSFPISNGRSPWP